MRVKFCLIFVFLLIISTTSFADELRRLTNRGSAELRRGNVETALLYFSQAVDLDPQSQEALFNKAIALVQTANVEEAVEILENLQFDENTQNIQVLNLRAKIMETMGDILANNEMQPNFSQARVAYQTSRALYAQILDLNPRDINHRTYIKARIENLSNKIAELPEDEQDESNDENNEDGENGESGDNNQDQDQNSENDENQENNDENDDENNRRNQDRDEEERRRQEEREREMQERIDDAERIIEFFADDANELRRPPAQEEAPAPGGRNW